jgi:hypothetical protein
MKIRTLIITTILSTGLAAGYSYAAENITTSTVNTATTPITKEEMADPRVAAGSFVEHVNYARVALAMKNTDLAKQHLIQAKNMMTVIKGATTEQLRVTSVESGRVVYQYETTHKYHYFPIQTGRVQVKEMSNGSFWAENELAVTDADIVYLTLDLTGDKAETYLIKAEDDIIANDLKSADEQLAMLTDAVVVVDERVSVPNDKARDNISLARNFISGKNYDGASFALNHADNALDEMQRSDKYKTHRANIIAMRKDVSDLQGYIAKKDPTMIKKADVKLDKWWNEMKSWADGN